MSLLLISLAALAGCGGGRERKLGLHAYIMAEYWYARVAFLTTELAVARTEFDAHMRALEMADDR